LRGDTKGEFQMRFLQRDRDEREAQQQPQQQTPEAAPGSNLNELRLAGEEFLAAGFDAISKSLSGDSEAFLASTKQQGGQ
jgi:hypothetical protein